MTASAVDVHEETYLDSLVLMAATVRMGALDGVEWAGAVMASPSGLADLADAGFTGPELDGLGANDFVLAVRAVGDDELAAALAAGREAAFGADRTDGGGRASGEAEAPPRSLRQAVGRLDGANVAIVSVPGPFAALEAHHALTAGLHVLLFSDGVPLDEEIELKQRGADLGLLVMGPGAGTAVLGGTGLGFANVMRSSANGSGSGAVGVVAAAGTGAQEVSALLSRWGVPVSHVVGVGGRDLSEAVEGRMAQLAVRAFAGDPRTTAVLLVSKPPAPSSAQAVLSECTTMSGVAVFLGLEHMVLPAGVTSAPTLEAGARAAAELVGAVPPAPSRRLRDQAAEAAARLGAARVRVQGLFSGGTLCYEAQLVLERNLGPVHSNEPLRKERGLPAPDGAHVLLDLGAEEYTRGVPHPMIDPSTRLDQLRRQADDPSLAVVLLDVVLGHGAAEDPAGQLATACAELMAGDGPQVVAYVLGTEDDPQVYSRQRAVLEDAGCLVAETNAEAARTAAALALRRPELVESGS
jgi:FdrA protein